MKVTRGGFYNFFMPNAAALNTVINIGASSTDHGEWVCIRPCRAREFFFIATDEAVGGDTTAPTVIFTKRPTPKSSSGEQVVGVLTVPHGTAVGVPVRKKVVAEDGDNYFGVGDALEVSHTVGVGSPTGQGIVGGVFEEDPEYAANMAVIDSST